MSDSRGLKVRLAVATQAARARLIGSGDTRGRMRQRTAIAARAIVDLLLPPSCAWCAGEVEPRFAGMLLCGACQHELAGPAVPRCARCGGQLALAGGACGICAKREFRFDGVVTLGAYAGALRECVLRLKRVGNDPLALAVGRLLAAGHREGLSAWRADVILPVPMHWRRRLWRRVNSPELLAEALGRELAVGTWNRVLRRVRNTHKQGPMLRTERLENVRGAFRLAAEADVRGRRVLVVDDIMTTGATCDEVAKVLQRGGAASVLVAVAARADGR